MIVFLENAHETLIAVCHNATICRCQCLAWQSTVAIYWALEGCPSIDTIAFIAHSWITHWHYQALCTFSLVDFYGCKMNLPHFVTTTFIAQCTLSDYMTRPSSAVYNFSVDLYGCQIGLPHNNFSWTTSTFAKTDFVPQFDFWEEQILQCKPLSCLLSEF